MSDKFKMTQKEFTNTIYSLIIASSEDLFKEINKNSFKYDIEVKINKNKLLNFKITNDNVSFTTTGYLLGMIDNDEFIWTNGLVDFFKEQFIKFAKNIDLNKNTMDAIVKLYEPDSNNVLKLDKKYLMIVPYLITSLFAYSDINVIQFESKVDGKNILSFMIIKDFPIECDKKTIEKTDTGFTLMNGVDNMTEISRNKKNLNKKIKKSLLKKASKNLSKKFINMKNIKKYKLSKQK